MKSIMKFIKRINGFTLVEVIVVASITILLAALMMANLGRGKGRIDDVAKEVVADIRYAQTKALAGSTYNNTLRCGYGIHYANPGFGNPILSDYAIYVGPIPNVGNSYCTLFNRTYDDGEDTEIITKILKYNYRFRDEWVGGQNGGIFFQPPNPTTYIKNNPSLIQPAAAIVIQPNNQNSSYCSLPAEKDNCRAICVYPSGKINILHGKDCP